MGPNVRHNRNDNDLCRPAVHVSTAVTGGYGDAVAAGGRREGWLSPTVAQMHGGSTEDKTKSQAQGTLQGLGGGVGK